MDATHPARPLFKTCTWYIEVPKEFRGNKQATALFLENIPKNPWVTQPEFVDNDAIWLSEELTGREFRERVLLPVMVQTRQDLAKETGAAR